MATDRRRVGDRRDAGGARRPTSPPARAAHDLAFYDDSRFAFVTNEADGTVSVIDAGQLAEAARRAGGLAPRLHRLVDAGPGGLRRPPPATAPSWSSIGAEPKPRARIAATPGLGQIRFAPGGRLAFVVHPSADAVHILDAASDRIVQTADVEAQPDQVTFSDELAYVRHRGSDSVLMIPLKIGRRGRQAGAGGGLPRRPAPARPPAAPDPGRRHRAGPRRERHAGGQLRGPGIYFYKEGMAAPMGHFQNYGKQPLAALVVDRCLREVRPGVYETMVKMAGAGDYELALFIDSPKLVQCFPVKVAVDPALAAARKPCSASSR